MVFKDIMLAIGVPVGRCLLGWLQNALEDGKISDFEWRQLGITLFSVGVPTLALFFSFNAAGIDLSAFGAACGGLLVDMIIKALKARKAR